MLVLTRKDFQSLMIGEAKLTVIESKNGKVKIGIEADKSIPIVRSELLLPPEEQEKAA